MNERPPPFTYDEVKDMEPVESLKHVAKRAAEISDWDACFISEKLKGACGVSYRRLKSVSSGDLLKAVAFFKYLRRVSEQVARQQAAQVAEIIATKAGTMTQSMKRATCTTKATLKRVELACPVDDDDIDGFKADPVLKPLIEYGKGTGPDMLFFDGHLQLVIKAVVDREACNDATVERMLSPSYELQTRKKRRRRDDEEPIEDADWQQPESEVSSLAANLEKRARVG